MALKPIPRLILIVAVVGAAAYGGMKYLDSRAPANLDSNPNVRLNDPPANAPQPKAATVAVAPPPAAAGGGATFQSIVDKGTVRVSVQSPAKPFYYVENGKPQGFNYEFLKVLFAQSEFTPKGGQVNIDTDHIVDTYPDVPAALLKNDNRGNPTVDIAIDGLTFTDEDLPGVVYSIPYVEDFGYALITPKTTSIRSVEDLNGLTIGILKGDPDVKAYASRQFPKARLVELSDESANGERNWINNFIKKGQVDAVIYDYPFGVAEIRGTDLQFAVSKLPGSNIKYKIGVRKADGQLLENINIAIRKVKALPEYGELVKKYFTSANLAKVKTADKTETVYVVKVGDTLSKIAAATLGNNMRFGEIESRNNLPNPNLIHVGQKLVIPKG
jgi:ABC-type amino acid transport substrate-binding protein